MYYSYMRIRTILYVRMCIVLRLVAHMYYIHKYCIVLYTRLYIIIFSPFFFQHLCCMRVRMCMLVCILIGDRESGRAKKGNLQVLRLILLFIFGTEITRIKRTRRAVRTTLVRLRTAICFL